MCKDFFAHQQNTLTNWLYYLPVYDTLLGHNVETNVAILEIGVWKGGSLDMWRSCVAREEHLHAGFSEQS